MRANLPAYDLWVPSTLDHALQALDTEPNNAQPFAGGTDLMVLLEAGVLQPSKFMSILGLK